MKEVAFCGETQAENGVVKDKAGDPGWAELTALYPNNGIES